MMKFSENFERDWKFYLSNKDKLTFCGSNVELRDFTENGKTAKECFHRYDSNGQWLPCREPELLREIIFFKKALNLHIKMWAEGFHDMCEPIEYYLNIFVNPPDWVKVALRKAIDKKIYNKSGNDK